LTGDSDPLSPVGVSVLVCNHVMEGDWWAVLMLARCLGLRGSVKAFLQRKISGNTVSTSSNAAATSYINNINLSNAGSGGRYSPPSNNNNNNNSSMTENYNITANTININKNNSHNDSGSGSNSSNTSSIPMSASAPILNAPLHQHGFKRNLSSHQAVGSTGGGPGIATTTMAAAGNTAAATTNSFASVVPLSSDNNNNNNNNHNNNNNTSSTNAATATTATTTPSSTSFTSLAISFLHILLEFPLLSSEHTQNYIADRNELFSLLRSFASAGAPAPIHLLLFPEGWPSGDDRKKMVAKSIEFAKREGRPQLKHLLLPRTTGFYASLDSLREASPVVYDITMAYSGYDGGCRPFSCDVGLGTIMKLITGDVPSEVHIRIKRYSMEEVLSDASWLDKQWAEKDRLLGKFVRSGNFANVDNHRGFCRYRVLDTRGYSVESSITALLRLGLIPFAIPVILFLFVPILWGVAWVWIAHRSFLLFFPGGFSELIGASHIGGDRYGYGYGYGGYGYGRGANVMSKEEVGGNRDDSSNGGTDSAAGTPFFPATPFASPTHVASWRSAAPGSSSKDSDSPPNGRR